MTVLAHVLVYFQYTCFLVIMWPLGCIQMPNLLMPGFPIIVSNPVLSFPGSFSG